MIHGVDMEPDGDIDIVGTCYWDGGIVWWENDGDENFTYHSIMFLNTPLWGSYPCDLDGDTDIDILCAFSWDNYVKWYENDGDENFTEHIVVAGYINAHGIHGADMAYIKFPESKHCPGASILGTDRTRRGKF